MTRQLAAVVAVLLVTVLLIGLGFWQWQRLGWKQALLADIERAMAASAVDLAPAIADPMAWDFRKVRLTGVFHHEYERHIHAIGRDGGDGYIVVTPLERFDGAWILVERGWVAAALKAPERRAEGQIAGVTMIEGIARMPRPRPPMAPDDDIAANVYFAHDVATLAAGLPRAPQPLLVDALGPVNPGGWPLIVAGAPDIPNHHLGYAITWFLLAGIFLVIMLIRMRGG